jgi:hypothetical protein
MSIPSKRTRKVSGPAAVLSSADNEMVAKLVSTIENYLKLKNESLALSVNQDLQSAKIYSVLFKRCPVSATVTDIVLTALFHFKDKFQVFQFVPILLLTGGVGVSSGGGGVSSGVGGASNGASRRLSGSRR